LITLNRGRLCFHRRSSIAAIEKPFMAIGVRARTGIHLFPLSSCNKRKQIGVFSNQVM